MKNKIRVFLSYSHVKGFGSCEMNISKKIDGYEDLKVLAQSLCNQFNLEDCAIIYWRYF